MGQCTFSAPLDRPLHVIEILACREFLDFGKSATTHRNHLDNTCITMKVGSKFSGRFSACDTADCFSEPQSKRVPVRLRHKIEKASAAKQRKAKKEAKKVQQSNLPEVALVLSIIEPAMALQDQERPWNSKPLPFQGQDSGRD